MSDFDSAIEARPLEPQACIKDAADVHAPQTRSLASRAGHEAAFVARIAPAAMVFVPSRAGISHAPEEWTETETIARASDVLALTLTTLDQRPLATLNRRL